MSLLQFAQPASIETVLAALINALGVLQQHIALILDDYYVIEELPIHRAMTFLIDHHPLQLHVVIASRVDAALSLSRLRARHQLMELRADDLHFTIDEAATFLNEIIGFQLTEHDIATTVSNAFGAFPLFGASATILVAGLGRYLDHQGRTVGKRNMRSTF